MKVVSFNANGIRSAASKGFFDWMHETSPDVVCIQETKAHKHQLEHDAMFFPEGYICEYVDAQKKGYSGVAIYSKKPPRNIIRTMGYAIADDEGRYLQFDYENLSIISLYLPSGTSGEGRQAIKYDFLEAFESHLLQLRQQGRELIVCGDYNIAHKQIDLKNWRSNQKNSGFLPEERAWIDKLFTTHGFVDAFRVKNQEELQYTWWSYRQRAWEKNVGWRIDYQVVTPGLISSIEEVSIQRDLRLSDHAPLTVQYSGDLCA